MQSTNDRCLTTQDLERFALEYPAPPFVTTPAAALNSRVSIRVNAKEKVFSSTVAREVLCYAFLAAKVPPPLVARICGMTLTTRVVIFNLEWHAGDSEDRDKVLVAVGGGWSIDTKKILVTAVTYFAQPSATVVENTGKTVLPQIHPKPPPTKSTNRKELESAILLSKFADEAGADSDMIGGEHLQADIDASETMLTISTGPTNATEHEANLFGKKGKEGVGWWTRQEWGFEGGEDCDEEDEYD
ncbi:hypothetical protein BCR33DRAFT_716027 [Rhizoclosmatium globosum]|uniref:Uncharacterized protein n=1 Tax=Rhizoclosmatium globosum TaxID=329046 RepID=A0A1Y2CG50_9FUNG|nr:hypothetical protein BCR33DRAFT_716027 [Rhizoclosmatium globosum]|eukprot:ORY46020.1 hypothetical protein BCR33DRAFT_716027 [Rhizoclosmatium globosum]